jgi:L-aspartate oxidase
MPETHTAPAPAAEARILIIGAGLAGLFLALRLAPRLCTVISPAPLGQAASSAWAQGGLAAALDPLDSPQQHAADTVAAGAGLVDPAVARLIAEEGPARVLDLITLGVPFDRTPDGKLALIFSHHNSFTLENDAALPRSCSTRAPSRMPSS